MGQKLLLCFSMFLTIHLVAQKQSRLDLAMRYIEQNAAEKWGLKAADYKDMVLNHYSYNEKIGSSYIYFNQANKGIQVKNAMLTLSINNDGKVIFASSTFVPDFQSKISGASVAIKAEDAIVAAASHLGVLSPEKPKAIKKSNNGLLEFEKTSYTDSPITACLKYELAKGKLIPVWECTLDMAANADYWEIRMDATTKTYVSKNNYTLYCTHHKGQYSKHENCGAEKKAKVDDVALPLSTALAAASYNVFALPAESPIHGPQRIVTDPHFTEVSPFGWHDINGEDGAEFTITRGNNVYAYTDKNNDDSPDDDVPQPEGGASLTFNFPYDLTKEALDNADAAQTNLFYMNNMMHDVMALYGFDEESGNYQSKNYSNRGQGNDFVLAQAFDGFSLSTPTLNNAVFSAPPDGGSGRMQMYLWEVVSGSISIDAPEQISGFISEFGTSQFGTPIPTPTEAPITASVVVARTNDIGAPTQCCSEVITDLTGKIALIDRGLCDFSKKVFNVQNKGAVAAIICNISGVNGGNGDELLNMAAGQNAAQVTIPSVFMKKSDCDRIRIVLNGNEDVVVTLHERENTGPAYLDGAIDNGIIAHEYGHGISSRLTGGPSQSGCLSNDEQMGEGWSDFFSLVMTVEAGDKGSDRRGIGNFATGASVDGGGIRRYPYSTDMNINPLTFDDIKGTTTPYPTGEVWTSCLWDMYWKMVEKYGYDANWKNLESGNAKAIRLVIEAMKMQGCNPGFLRGRDAIIAADEMLCHGDNLFLLWDVFARRGLGFYTDGGSENDRNDGIANFDPHPLSIEQLKITKTVTESINAGEDIDVTLKIVNHVPTKQTGVVVTDDLPIGASFLASSASIQGNVVNNKITFEIGDMDYKEEMTITYKLNTSTSNISPELINYGFEDFEEWEVLSNEGSSIWQITDLAANSGINSYFIQGEAAENDHSLVTPEFEITGNLPVFRFWHKFDTQNGIDGGFIQIATQENFDLWRTVKGGFIRNGYNQAINYSTFAIPELFGYSGTTNNKFIDTYLDLTEYKGKRVKLRFRYGSNAEEVANALLPGWLVDDVGMLDLYKYEGIACITNGDNTKGTCTLPGRTVVSGNSVPVKDITSADFEFNVTPIPANDFIVIVANSKSSYDARINLRNLNGQILNTYVLPLTKDQSSQLMINTSELSPGMYLITMQNESGLVSQKIVVE
jgi:hypothetical protein